MRTGAVLSLCLALLALPGMACAQNPPPLSERGGSGAPATEKQILDKLTKMIKQVEPERPKEQAAPPAIPKADLPPPLPAPITHAQNIPSPAPPPLETTPRPIDPPLPPMTKPAAAIPPHVRIRDVLNKTITLDHTAKDFPEVVKHLREKTGIPFVLDPAAPLTPTAVVLKATDVPLRTALNALLTQHHLGYAVVGETVLITTEAAAGSLRLRQLVQIDVNGAPLKTVLQQLSADAGINVVIDPRLRSTKVENEPITLNVQEVAVHNAVRLLAEFANLKSVQVGNVLVITTPENAARINQERSDAPVVRAVSTP